MYRFGFQVFSAVIAVLLVSVAGAQTPVQKGAGAESGVGKKTATVYEFLYGSCSRSMRLGKTCKTLETALDAAEEAGKTWLRTEVKSYDQELGSQGKYSKVGFRVYVGTQLRCLVRWKLKNEYLSRSDAIVAQKKLRDAGWERVQIVEHFSS